MKAALLDLVIREFVICSMCGVCVCVCVCVLMCIGHCIIPAYESDPEGESVCLSWGIMFVFLVIQGH